MSDAVELGGRYAQEVRIVPIAGRSRALEKATSSPVRPRLPIGRILSNKTYARTRECGETVRRYDNRLGVFAAHDHETKVQVPIIGRLDLTKNVSRAEFTRMTTKR